jgi:hypothetical protein
LSQNNWNTLEIAKLIVSIFTPIGVGWFINRKLKKVDLEQWSNQKIIEKKLSLYDKLAPDLNKLYCFYMWRGDWNEISPKDVIDIKRQLDRSVHIYRHLLGKSFFIEYQAFYNLLFSPHGEDGEARKDNKIISIIKGKDGDRKKDRRYKQWDCKWNDFFLKGKALDKYRKKYEQRKDEIHSQYDKLIVELTKSIGLEFVEDS